VFTKALYWSLSWATWIQSTPSQYFPKIHSVFYKGKGKVVPVLLRGTTPRRRIGSGGVAPHILNLGTRWRWVVSFTPRLLYPQRKSPWCPLDKFHNSVQNLLSSLYCLKIWRLKCIKTGWSPVQEILQNAQNRFISFRSQFLNRKRTEDLIEFIKTVQNYNFTCCFVLVWNMFPRTTGKTQIGGVWEQGAEVDICT
jgi:hypothetical protein